MENIITDNPFRVLGVFTNATRKEIVANEAKIRAFAKIGKSVRLPADNILAGEPPVRTEESLQKAVAAIALPKDKLAASMFWFVNIGTPEESVDEETLRHTSAERASVNLAVLNLIKRDYVTALWCYSFIFINENSFREYEHLIIGDTVAISLEEFAGVLADALIQHFPDADWHKCLQTKTIVFHGVEQDTDILFQDNVLCNKLISQLSAHSERALREAIAKAAACDAHDANANLMAAKQLESAVCHLYDLRLILGKDNQKYATLADAFANQLLNNCIAYGNNTEDYNRAEKCLPIIRCAMNNAQGMVTKDRCRKNYDIIKVEYERICERVRKQYERIIQNKEEKPHVTPEQAPVSHSNFRELYGHWKIIIAALFIFSILCLTLCNNYKAEVPVADVENVACDTIALVDTADAYYDDAYYDVTYYSTGDRPYIDYYGKGRYDNRTKNSLKITNDSPYDAVVFLVTPSGRKIRHVYVGFYEHFTMTGIPSGKYVMKVLQGQKWNAEKENGIGAPAGGFMEDVSMSCSDPDDTFDYPAPETGRYAAYTVTLQKKEGGNLDSQDVDADDFY